MFLGLFFYSIFISVYAAGIRIAALWNPKARAWVNGRKRPLPLLPVPAPGKPVIWMHCASLGEFEQGRPLLDKLREECTGCVIVLSFFSPSGYEVVKDLPVADHVLYLPMDSKDHARQFIEAIKPSLVLWVKYDYWLHYLFALQERKIPVLLVSGVFRKGQRFFAWHGAIWRKVLRQFDHLFVQNSASQQLLAGIGIRDTVTVSGDTRFDRVISIAEQFIPVPGITGFCGDHKVIVAGSTWEEDETELIHYAKAHPEIRFIVAPHEVDKQNLADVMREFPNAIFYSKLVGDSPGAGPTTNVLIIDNIGMLSRLYHYATIAYVGGGFGDDGVHNVLEAAVYGKPVFYGPEYAKFAEATGLIEAGGGITISNALELEDGLRELFADGNKLEKLGAAAKAYVYAQSGATEKIMAFIQEKRLLTN